MIELRCSHCGKRIKVSESHAGKKGRCPECKNVVTVPQTERKVHFECSMCQQKLEARESFRGELIECPACGCFTEVPETEDDIGENHNLVDKRPDLAARLYEQLKTWRIDVDAKVPAPNCKK